MRPLTRLGLTVASAVLFLACSSAASTQAASHHADTPLDMLLNQKSLKLSKAVKIDVEAVGTVGGIAGALLFMLPLMRKEPEAFTQ